MLRVAGHVSGAEIAAAGQAGDVLAALTALVQRGEQRARDREQRRRLLEERRLRALERAEAQRARNRAFSPLFTAAEKRAWMEAAARRGRPWWSCSPPVRNTRRPWWSSERFTRPLLGKLTRTYRR